MPQIFDLFLSYRWADKPCVEPVLAALAARGVSVWQDAHEIENLASIQLSVTKGLASCRALLAWYSLRYNDSRACQWELTSAYVAGQAEGDPRQRILVVNPEATNAHVFLPELFDQLHLSGQGVAGDPASVSRLAEQVVDALGAVPGTPLGSLKPVTPPSWVPAMGNGSNRFVGRLREMWDLHGKLRAGQAAMLTGAGGKAGLALVRGAGGIGKSLMAEEYALRFGAAYPGGVFWLRAFGYADGGTEMTPQQRTQSREAQFIDVAERLGLDTKGLTAAQVSGELARHLGGQGLPFLWVVDDFPGDAKVEEIGAWQAPHPLGCTLLTSRTRRFNHLATIELPQLDPLDARRLLVRQRLLSAEEVVIADQICGLLGNHALAVDVTAALMLRRGLTETRDALRHPGRDALELAAKLDEALPNGHQREIAATFLASIAQLDEPARELLRYAAELAVAPIPVQLLVDVTSAANCADDKEARDRVDLAVSQLLGSSLADDAGIEVISVHTLVSHTIRATHVPTLQNAGAQGESFTHLRRRLVEVLTIRITDSRDVREYGRLELWVPHGRLLSEAADTVEGANLLGRLARFDLARGAYMLAVSEFERMFAVLRRLLGEEHPDTLVSRNDLALAHLRQGDMVSARELLEETLAIQRRLLRDEHPDTLNLMGNLAATYKDLGDLTGARSLQEKTLAIQRNVLGECHPDTLTSMCNLGTMLDAQGDLAGARSMLERTLEIQQRVLGNEHPNTLASLGNLALTLYRLGHLANARSLQEQSLAIHCDVFGAEHPNTLLSMNNLAGILEAQGHLEGVRSIYERILSIQRSSFGEEHPSTWMSMSNLAETLSDQGDLAGARDLQQQVLANRIRVLGEEHPDTLVAINNLARTLSSLGDFAGARSKQDHGLAVNRRVLGGDHPTTLVFMCNLATTLHNLGDLAGARSLLEEALDILRRVLGDEHQYTLTAMGSLAITLGAQGHLARARSLQEELLAIQRRLQGDEHSSTLASMRNLALTLWQQGERDNAIVFMGWAAKGMAAAFGSDHSDTQECVDALIHMQRNHC
jgi:tetratricopeptide (TPR) repeat protein